MKVIVYYLIIFLTFYSCKEIDENYKIINSVIKKNNNLVGSLSNENININNFIVVVDIPELNEYNIQYPYTKIDTNRIDIFFSREYYCEMKISLPFFHLKDRNRAVIFVEKNCTINSTNIHREVYFIRKILFWWIIEKHINNYAIS